MPFTFAKPTRPGNPRGGALGGGAIVERKKMPRIVTEKNRQIRRDRHAKILMLDDNRVQCRRNIDQHEIAVYVGIRALAGFPNQDFASFNFLAMTLPRICPMV